jgi:enoyl-CoA hydratase/carnithine racemase
MTAESGLLIVDRPPLRRCVLQRPARRNALSLALCEDLRAAVSSVPEQIAMIAITNAGDIFSSGADLAELAPDLLRATPPPSHAPTLRGVRAALSAVEQAPVTVVAAVDGRCLAGGLELALAADCFAATRRSRFFDGHLTGALLPSGGAGIRLPERVGRGRAFRLLVEGVEIDADTALTWGLVDVVHADGAELSAWLEAMAARLAGLPGGLVRRIRHQLSAATVARDHLAFETELQDLDSYVLENRDELRLRLARYLGNHDG